MQSIGRLGSIKSVTLSLLLAGLVGCTLLGGPTSAKFIHYPVKSGDTLSAIAKRFGSSVNEILALNGLRSERDLKLGQVLRMPYRPNKIGAPVIGQAPKETSLVPRDQKSVNTIKLSLARKQIGRLAWPVVGAGHISSRFGSRWLSFHEGIDIAGAEGLPVVSAHDGTVVYSGDGLTGYGNLVVVKGSDIMTVYGHNRENLVRVGKCVKRGEQIAELGQSGKATGPHLHFEVRIKNKEGGNVAVDPLAFYPQR